MDQLVEVKPTELRFTVAAGVQSTVTLRLRSLVADALLFKFKTTAPLRYAVQPNASVIAPGASADITVVLKLFKVLPPEMGTWRDKFMLQIARVDPATSALSVEEGMGGAERGRQGGAGEEGPPAVSPAWACRPPRLMGWSRRGRRRTTLAPRVPAAWPRRPVRPRHWAARPPGRARRIRQTGTCW